MKCKADHLSGSSDRAGEVLLKYVDERKADLLVMGCYGHSRFREFILGGASRLILANMVVPVLMSHSARALSNSSAQQSAGHSLTSSMHKKDRDFCRVDHGLRTAAEQGLSRMCMAVTAHDDEIGPLLLRRRKKHSLR